MLYNSGINMLEDKLEVIKEFKIRDPSPYCNFMLQSLLCFALYNEKKLIFQPWRGLEGLYSLLFYI